MHSIEPGTIIDDRYRVLTRIGSGGMADVYLVEDIELGRRVAVKVLHQRYARDPEFVERFRREASSAAGLQHSNVVAIFDRGAWHGTYYIAMEYLSGRTLKEIIRERGSLPPDEAIDIACQLLKAVGFAHQNSIVHRDLKPHNVIVDDDGVAKVTDFGIARAGTSEMTETGSVLGTAHYIAPEQAQGHAVTESSDLYSIGVILYELLTGHVPFEGDSAVSVALKHVSETPPSPSMYSAAISPELEGVLLRALRKNPSDRYHSAQDFAGALMAVKGLLPKPGVIRNYEVDENPTQEHKEEKRWWPFLVAGIAILGLAALIYFVFFTAEQHTVPNVVGRKAETAAQILRNDGFKVDIDEVASTTVPTNTVSTQSPQPGEKAKKGSEVTIVVSKGPGDTSVPYVDGYSQSKALQKLRAAGFIVEITKRTSNDVKAGYAIETQPSANSQIESGSTVTLIISSGPQLETVPDTTGLTQEDAETVLDDVGFEVVVKKQESSTVTAGNVVSQTPPANSKRAAGSKITIVVADESNTVTVPDVVGDTLSQATTALTQLGLTIQSQETAVTDQSKDGLVIKQSPAGGTKRSKGAQVSVSIGSYTAPTG